MMRVAVIVKRCSPMDEASVTECIIVQCLKQHVHLCEQAVVVSTVNLFPAKESALLLPSPFYKVP